MNAMLPLTLFLAKLLGLYCIALAANRRNKWAAFERSVDSGQGVHSSIVSAGAEVEIPSVARLRKMLFLTMAGASLIGHALSAAGFSA
jgi:hypothetical protein